MDGGIEFEAKEREQSTHKEYQTNENGNNRPIVLRTITMEGEA